MTTIDLVRPNGLILFRYQSSIVPSKGDIVNITCYREKYKVIKVTHLLEKSIVFGVDGLNTVKCEVRKINSK